MLVKYLQISRLILQMAEVVLENQRAETQEFSVLV